MSEWQSDMLFAIPQIVNVFVSVFKYKLLYLRYYFLLPACHAGLDGSMSASGSAENFQPWG